MSTPPTVPAVTPSGVQPTAGADDVLAAAAPVDTDTLPRVSRGWISLTILAAFGIQLALVTPIAISLAIQVDALAPGREEYLGYLLSVGALSGLLLGPVFGQLGDRTRTRIGRRRPWIIGGVLVATVGLAVMGTATSILVLGIGWVIVQIGYIQAGNTNVALQADKLPESQRGQVAGLWGVATMASPVFGVIIGSTVADQPVLLFLVPGAIAVLLVIPLVLFAAEPDSRGLTFPDKLTVRMVASKYVYNPRRYPDYSWNWLARFAFFFGLTLYSTYTAFFYADRLDMTVTEVSGLIGIVGIVGVLATMGGAFSSGFLSDKYKRRKPFVLLGGALFALGAVITAFAPGLPLLVVGTVLAQLSIGVFAAVDQALMLDVLPERETEAARFINISQFSIGLPQALAPLAASLILAAGAQSGGDRNYTLLYLLSGVLAVVGALLVLRVRSVR